MLYAKFVEENKIAYIQHELLEKARDTAKILDNPLFVEISQEVMVCVRESLADVGNYFQYLCHQCNLKLTGDFLRFANNQRVLLPKNPPFDPGKTARILVVDDDLTNLIDTARAFIGWPHLHLEFYHYQSLYPSIKRIVNNILEKNPDIVLMDQDLDNLNGHDVIGLLRKETNGIIFVSNTDSEDDSKMLEVGCLSNCGKGNFPEGLRNALRIFKNRA